MQTHTKQEFFTLDTRITIQRGNIYHKRLKSQSEEIQYRFTAFIAFLILVFISILEIVEEQEYFNIIRIVLIASFFSSLFKRIYQTLFIKTWKSIIPLKDVKNITTKPLDNGLETEVTLHLKSGRKKWYTFRNAEGQLELFIDAVAAQTTLPAQMAL